jgi:hypothetical protein
LAELALDAEKNTNKGGFILGLGQGQGKSKGKKKKQYYRKVKDSKVLITGFLFLFIAAVVVLYIDLTIYHSCIVGNRWW